MSSSHPLPPVPASPPSSGGVRRHHTISSSSRHARAAAKESISEEAQEQDLWHDDEPVDQDWVGGVGAVGEKTSLHRQSSLPTRYHRGFHGNKSGNLTPKTVNSLAAIAGHEGDEEPWNIADYEQEEDDQSTEQLSVQHQQVIDAQSPLSAHFANEPSHAPSPPPAGSGAAVRRHVSLTYGAAVGGPRRMGQNIKRAETMEMPSQHRSQGSSPPDTTEHAEEEEDEYTYDPEEVPYAEAYTGRQQQQYSGSSARYDSNETWGSNGEWMLSSGTNYTPISNVSNNSTIDDVQRALSALELASTGQQQYMGDYAPTGQSMHPPRFNPAHPPPLQAPGAPRYAPSPRGGNGNGNVSINNKLQLVTEFDGRKTPLGQTARSGGSGNGQYQQQQYQNQNQNENQQRDDRGQSSGGNAWEQRDRGVGRHSSNTNLQYGYQQGQHNKSGSGGAGVPNVPPIPTQYLHNNQGQGQGQTNRGFGAPQNATSNSTNASGHTSPQNFGQAAIDVPSLIAAKGYNPANFDIRPAFARYFVIKSYTEDDVHKSLKYEIWSSTDPGNKRLDKAFKETASRGPIYLFFSVNASGHFCGMAEMLTPVDYTRSSTVWASDKWKGVFKVRWIFVRDIPNVNLRHIKLNNTQERKPVTNSRDTQELLPDAGQEMLRIFHTHPARTSLLQDFAFYELQAIQKQQGGAASPVQSAGSAVHSPQLQPASISPAVLQQQNAFAAMANTYQIPHMMQMQMGMGMGMNMGMGSQYIPQTQAMHQSVMRHPSPGPQQGNGQGFVGMHNF